MAPLNFVSIDGGRNGTNTHTVDPSSATGLVAGSAFSPTSGRLLVCVVEGPVTSTTPSGWTLPTGGSAVNNSGLYVWYRTAAGADTISTTHNGSNFPVSFTFMEFGAGSTFTASVSSTSTTYNGANPSLTGLTGTQQVFAAKAWNPGGAAAVTGTWGSPTVELLDSFIPTSGTDGYWVHLGGIEDYASASYAPTSTKSVPAGTHEALTFALVSAGGTPDPVPPPLVMAPMG